MKKNKGFTLIEIIVSLMIASIGMLIATTLILNSMGYFNKTAVSDNDKQVLDSIRDYVHNELIYASNVKIQTEYPKKEDGTLDSEWHYLFVKDHQLYRDSNCEADFTKAVPVYGSDFYTNGRKLFVEARGFNNYRIDFKFYLTDRNGTESDFDSSYEYKTSTTVEMLNMKEYVSNKGGQGLFAQAKLESLSDETDKKLKVFYKKGELELTTSSGGDDEEDFERDGTVKDEILCVKGNKEDNAYDLYKTYKAGDYVYYNGVWYKSLWDSNTAANPEASWLWKPLKYEFVKNKNYEKGDIVFYEGKFYQARYTSAGASQTPDDSASGAWYGPFDSVESLVNSTKIIPDYFKCPIESGTVEDEFDKIDLTKATPWVATNYEKGAIVYTRVGSGINDLKYYISIDQGMSATSPDITGASGTIWKCLDSMFDDHSKYQIGDIIYVKVNGEKVYYRVIANSPGAYPPGNYKNPLNDPSGWEKVKKDSTGNWVVVK